MTKLSKEYWEKRYIDNSTSWDLGEPSTPIKEYIDQLKYKDSKILIPGAGNAHEANYLFENGFKNIYILDIAPSPLEYAKKRINLPSSHFIQQDYFKYSELYDIIFELTFFCALEPRFRESYVKKTHTLLKDGGCLIGVLFNFENKLDGPPFGGSVKEYTSLFEPFFDIIMMRPCYNSVPTRKGKELFIKLIKKNNGN